MGGPGEVRTLSRAPRADAVRNRAALLSAARDVFAAHGSDVATAQLARDSGVSKAALFRHFSTKRDLFVAVLAENLATLCARLEGTLEIPDAEEALRAFMLEGAGHIAETRGLLEQTSKDVLDEPEIRVLLAAQMTACERILARAQGAGVVREDVRASDLFVLLKAPAATARFLEDVEPEVWRRYLGLLLDGLRPEGARPLDVAAPDPAGMPGLTATAITTTTTKGLP